MGASTTVKADGASLRSDRPAPSIAPTLAELFRLPPEAGQPKQTLRARIGRFDGLVAVAANSLTRGERDAVTRRVVISNAQSHKPRGDAEPAFPLTAAGRARLAAILAFVDALAEDPRRIRRDHIEALQSHGLAIADVAALTRLVALLKYRTTILAAIVARDDAEPSPRRTRS